MDEQRRVAAFLETHGLATDPAHRALDLVSEVGEIAKEINESTAYGGAGPVEIAPDELGDALFALLALAEAVDVDAGDALGSAIAKYEARISETGDAGSS